MPSTAPPRKTGAEFVEIVNEFLIATLAPAQLAKATTMSTKPTTLVTGAAHGIGRATAIALVERGIPVGLIDRDAPALAELARTLKDSSARLPSRRPRSTSPIAKTCSPP